MDLEEAEKEPPEQQSVGKGAGGMFQSRIGRDGASEARGRVGCGGAAPSNERCKQMRPMRPWPDGIRRVGAARGHDGLRAKPIPTALSDWRNASVCCGNPVVMLSSISFLSCFHGQVPSPAKR